MIMLMIEFVKENVIFLLSVIAVTGLITVIQQTPAASVGVAQQSPAVSSQSSAAPAAIASSSSPVVQTTPPTSPVQPLIPKPTSRNGESELFDN